MALVGSVVREVRSSVATARSRDPAARGVSPLEILATWPGVHALLAYRLGSALYAAGGGIAVRDCLCIEQTLLERPRGGDVRLGRACLDRDGDAGQGHDPQDQP